MSLNEINQLVPSNIDGLEKITALQLCVWHNKKECLKLLLRAGADVSVRSSCGKTAYEISKDKNNEECAKLVMKCSFKRNKLSKYFSINLYL